MPIDPTEASPRVMPRPEPLGELTPRALLRIARHHLLRIYSPQQAAIWLTAHSTGDSREVACKARRLSQGHERGSAHHPTTASPRVPTDATRTDAAPPDTLDLDLGTRAFGDVPDASTVVPRIVATVRAALTSASRVVVTLTPRVAEELFDAAEPVVPGGRRWHAPDIDSPSPELRRCLVVPMIGDGSVLGTLHLYADGPAAFRDEDRAVATVLAAGAAAMIRDAARTAVGHPGVMDDDRFHVPVEDLLMTRPHDDETSAADDLNHATRRVLVAGADGPTANPGDRPGAGRGHQLSDLQVHEILLAAIRDIFTSEQPEEIQAVLLETVDRLGGRIARAVDADEHPIPVDLSLTVGEPLLAIPRTDAPITGEYLWSHLPRLVEDARQAVERVERNSRLAADAEHDALTGLFNRRAYERFAGRLRSGDVLVLLDLDDFKMVNDTRGHLVGDQVLRVFGAVLRDQMRITEQAVRLGGDEFLIVLEGPGEDGADLLLERLEVAWHQRRPAPVTFSSGVAVVTTGVDAALEAADRALYERKRARAGAVDGPRASR